MLAPALCLHHQMTFAVCSCIYPTRDIKNPHWQYTNRLPDKTHLMSLTLHLQPHFSWVGLIILSRKDNSFQLYTSSKADKTTKKTRNQDKNKGEKGPYIFDKLYQYSTYVNQSRITVSRDIEQEFLISVALNKLEITQIVID